MNETLLIKYYDGMSDGFDLKLLGESFSGMSNVVDEILELTGLKGEVELKTTRITQGSVEIHNAVCVTFTGLPFNSITELYHFLQLADTQLLSVAKDFFSGSLGVDRTLDDFYAQHPFTTTGLTWLVSTFVVKAFKWAAKQKSGTVVNDPELGIITLRNAKKLRSMILSGKYTRALRPLAESSISSISLSTARDAHEDLVVITEQNMGDYIPDDDRILPEFENGETYALTGTLVSLQSMRGEILKIRLDNVENSNSLVTAHPQDGQSTEDFTMYYKKHVSLTLEAVRTSMYKRPEFVVQDMTISQQQLL